jgi:hypothetical protein
VQLILGLTVCSLFHYSVFPLRRCCLQAQLLVSHVSHHNVRVLRFCPFEPDTFLSAGRDSVRTYRLKGGSLRGISVRLEVRLSSVYGVAASCAVSALAGISASLLGCYCCLLTAQQQPYHGAGATACQPFAEPK